MEVYVPELSTAAPTSADTKDKKEAWLDVWGYGVCEYPDLLLDVRVTHPNASRYRGQANAIPGYAAAVGENEKHDRYPSSQGRDIIAVVHETWGRLGMEAETFLERLAAAARRRSLRRRQNASAALVRWRERLDGTLHLAVATQLAAALHGLPGKRPYRRTPVDLSCMEIGAAD